MFGYILPEKPELKIREYELFRAYYCGVCKSIGKRHGQLSRLALNYDSTFLAILISALTNEKVLIKSERCLAHPVIKRSAIKNNQIVDYASDINIILAYYKLKDNWKDEKSAVSAVLMLLLNNAFKKLRKRYLLKCDLIEKRLSELSVLEEEKCSSMDAAAEPFAKLMEEITAYEPVCLDKKHEKILRWIGYNLGKWIYILDAYDDLKDDIHKKNYNSLIYQYNYSGEDIDIFRSRIRDKVEFNLTFSLNQIAKAFELLNVNNNKGLLENIIYMGMLRKTENILKAGSCINSEKSI